MTKTASDFHVGRNGAARFQLRGHRATLAPLPDLPKGADLSVVDAKKLLREILRRIGDDPEREGLEQTPDRVVRSWKELYAGYSQRAEEILVTQFQAEQYDAMVLLRESEFFSICEHHMLPLLRKGAHRLLTEPEDCRPLEAGAADQHICAQTPSAGAPHLSDRR